MRLRPATRRRRRLAAAVAVALTGVVAAAPEALAAAPGDPGRGEQVFRACATCHALAPGRHRTGPSLAGVVGRAAGAAEGFRRYSPALKASGVVWDEAALDAWVKDPQAFIPGSRMPFRGLADERDRADLVAYLERAAAPGATPADRPADPDLPDLKAAAPKDRVTAIRRCGDTYEVTTGDGVESPFWEFNLRFKTDGSAQGPAPDRPVIVGTGMGGDRAAIVFAGPAEISRAIEERC